MTTKKNTAQEPKEDILEEQDQKTGSEQDQKTTEPTEDTQDKEPGVIFETLTRRDVSMHVIHTHMMATIAATAVLRFPGVSFTIVAAAQVKMLHAISRIYGVPFTKEAARAVIGSLVGAAVPSTVGRLAMIGGNAVPGAAMQKLPSVLQGALPAMGSILGLVAMPALAGASTYAIGRIFIAHFESGGTLLNFDAKKHVASFKDALRRGKKKTEEAKPDVADEAAGEPAPAPA